MSAPSVTQPSAARSSDQPPTVVVDGLHVVYRVLASGRRADTRRRLLRKGRARTIRQVHAVKGVSFVAHEGEAIGLIGANGSGKSTLLRAIAGLVAPTQGRVWAEGEPALLGVNAALVNELTGERNILLGGLALGLGPDEVRDRYEEIVEFSGIGDAVDLPMSTYSSGMGARLRFAIASATTHRILLIDEALATGDAKFRRRSEQRIRHLREQAGTVFLVSHSLSVVTETCERALWLDKGELKMDGPAADVVAAYRSFTSG